MRILKAARPALLSLVGVAVVASGTVRSQELERAQASASWAPLQGFIENRGQVDPVVRFYAAGGRASLFFVADGVVIDLHGVAPGTERPPMRASELPSRSREERTGFATGSYALKIRFVEADPRAQLTARDRLSAEYHFLRRGDDPQTGSPVHGFGEVVYRNVWPGIDLVYGQRSGKLVYRIVASAGADLSRVKFDYEGASGVLEAGGSIWIETPAGIVRDERPDDTANAGTISVTASVASRSGAGDPAQPQRPAGLPPTDQTRMDLYWSTFLGGSRDDTVFGVARDGSMRPVVTGTTRSVDFPTTLGAYDTSYAGSFDIFVTKLAADGSAVLWSTFLGDTGDDRGWAIQLDAADQPVVAGITASTGFPVTAAAFDRTHNGSYDAFAAKLTADGRALVWSTFYGGSDSEWDVSGLVLDAQQRPVIIGSSRSANLPTTPGAFDRTLAGISDGFVAELSADGSALVFGTFLGGGRDDAAEDVTLDAAGRPVVVGRTYSSDFPVTPGAFQPALAGGGSSQDVFVSKLAADGSSLVFSTYLGGDGNDEGYAIAPDGLGGVYVTGVTTSPDFPTTPGAFSRSRSGIGDAFVTRLAPDGASLLWSTYFGGGVSDKGLDIATDQLGRPVIIGTTSSPNFPAAGDPYDASFNDIFDAFVAKLQDDGTFPVYSTYAGGWDDDAAYAVALDGLGRPIVGGQTFSTNFPTTAGAFDSSHNSPDTWYDAFLFHLLPGTFCTHVTGATPSLRIDKALGGNCPIRPPEGNLTDLVEGRLEQLNANDIGTVRAIACDAAEATFENDAVPSRGHALFQLARYSPAGTYGDGDGPGLVGTRVPAQGDCP
jgi:hypothetical protein